MKTLLAALAAITVAATSWVASHPPEKTSDPARLEISVPAAITAGEELSVEITSDPGATVTVHFFNGYTGSTRQLTMLETSGRLAVPFTRFTGRLDIVAEAGSRRALATTSILARDLLDPPVPLVGARSIVADGADQAMAAVIPSDRYGNPAPAGTSVEINVQHPDRALATFRADVIRTVAWSWMPASTTAGTAVVTASVQGRWGPARTLLEIPGPPEAFAVLPETRLRPADGSTLVTVASAPLTDQHGNRIVDGTAAFVRASYPSGLQSQQTVTISGGIARALLEAPDRPGVVRVTMTVLGTTSAPLDLDFSAPLPTGGQP